MDIPGIAGSCHEACSMKWRWAHLGTGMRAKKDIPNWFAGLNPKGVILFEWKEKEVE